jgi:hypothetical protein
MSREDERTKTTPVCGLSHRLIDVVVFRGIFSIIQDPTGSILGLWKADPKMMHADQGAKTSSSARKQGAEHPARAH